MARKFRLANPGFGPFTFETPDIKGKIREVDDENDDRNKRDHKPRI